MKTSTRNLALTLALLAGLAPPTAFAQKSGQNAQISIGVVVKVDTVQLQSDAAKGALIGGTLAYQVSGDSRSKSTKWARAAGGAALGGAIKRRKEGDLTGRQYTVNTGPGTVVTIISDQTEIRQGDCVTVEQLRDTANIRRVDPITCEPASAAAVEALGEELQEEAEECLLAKDELLAAETQAQADLAFRKIDILCND